ncbi:MAG: NAD-dependent succinate-semialdehyde dehydrogenase [Alphaproteobacteria bacterium]|nr:NAD-dependent succinate-semialdehyde dehydrogenase [Alphaproteobacteria bacterium]
MSHQTQLFIAGVWRDGSDRRTLDVVNPATDDVIGTVACAAIGDLDDALNAAAAGFKVWRAVSALDRYKILRRAGELLRERVDALASILTTEQGKPLPESRVEILLSADVLDWAAEEGRRAYGRIIPGRSNHILQSAVREPVGPVAAFTPWNFPMSQVVRKIAPALGAGCSVIVKAAEDTPASAAELVRALADAGIPAGVLNLVFGDPAEISNYLIPHPVIRKISFTGSVPVGKKLAALAGEHMKRATMELGGHAPAIVFDDADLEEATALLTGSKFRNAGQVCVSPTRFLVQESVYDKFVERFAANANAIKVGNGLEAGTGMGPLVNHRRLQAVEDLIADAAQKGGTIRAGGSRLGNKGSFLEPTVLTEVTTSMRIMNEEPFGPIALIAPFRHLDDAVEEANRLPFGLAAYAFSRSARTVAALGAQVETGMLTFNHLGLALPEVPFGGVKDSGYGLEGGTEAMDAYLATKFLTHAP